MFVYYFFMAKNRSPMFRCNFINFIFSMLEITILLSRKTTRAKKRNKRHKECDFNFLRTHTNHKMWECAKFHYCFYLLYALPLYLMLFLFWPNEMLLLANHWPSHSMCTWYNLFYHYFLPLTNLILLLLLSFRSVFIYSFCYVQHFPVPSVVLLLDGAFFSFYFVP